MIPIEQFAKPESTGEKLSKTDWIDLALVAETTATGALSPDSRQALAVLQQLATEKNLRYEIVLIGADKLKFARALAVTGVDRVFVYRTEKGPDDPETLTAALVNFSEDYKPAVIVFPAALRAGAMLAAERIPCGVLSGLATEFTLNRKKDVQVDEVDCETLNCARPQLIVFADGFVAQTQLKETETRELPELFVCAVE